MIAPTVPPIAATAINWARTSGGNPTAAREARIPELTPKMPSTLPWRAVVCDANPEREPETGILVELLFEFYKRPTNTEDTTRQVSGLY